ncbi:MAG: permease-like cell division protein FtsX [Peptococcaceae bacterium]|nr:permease-like cell division protein FtsX [Peptococcaceae bacterium]MDH7524766.1 permease-like cell division protein FtsX [Peptococcaceae bacterium]
MKPSSFSYAFRDALRSLWRNKFMSMASVATVAISLLVLGSAWLLVMNTHHLAKAMESELEINVYLKNEVTREQALALKEQFAGIPGTAEVIFVSKEEGLKVLEERFGKETDLLEALGGSNPLPDVYRIKAQAAEDVPRIADDAGKIQGVEKVRYGQGFVEKLLSLTRWLRVSGIIAIFAVALAAVFLIATTIRLTVYARRHEVAIMKLVGATNWYIRWPFFLEGMVIGFTGALISVVSLYLFYDKLTENIALTVSFLPVMTDKNVLFDIYKNLLILGTGLGALGSAISLRRFLKI